MSYILAAGIHALHIKGSHANLLRQMALYKVNKISIYFSNRQPMEYMQKFFTIWYCLEGGKIISRNYSQTRQTMCNALMLPQMIEFDADAYARLPTGVPCQTNNPLKIIARQIVVTNKI